MDDPPDYNVAEAAAVATILQQMRSTGQIPTEQHTGQTQTSAVKSDDQPFRVALIMFRVSNPYIDSRGVRHSSKILKVKCGSIMIHRNMSREDFGQLQRQCVYDTYKLRGWKCAPRTDAELAAGRKYVTGDDWKAAISRLADEKDAGKDPVYKLSFSWKHGERVKLETESELSFSLKRLLDHLLMRRGLW